MWLLIDPMHDYHRDLPIALSFILYLYNRELHSSMVITDHTTLYTTLSGLDSKEVIRPQVPLRPPCYDFSLVAGPRFDNTNVALPRQESTSMKRRAVCARSRDVFTARW